MLDITPWFRETAQESAFCSKCVKKTTSITSTYKQILSLTLITFVSLLLSLNVQAAWVKSSINTSGNQPIHVIAIDPSDSNKIFVSSSNCPNGICNTQSGLYRSLNKAGIGSWIQEINVNIKQRQIQSIAIAKGLTSSSSTIFIAVEGKGVFASTDGGNNWVLKPIHPAGDLGQNIVSDISQLITTDRVSGTQIIYAVVSSYSNNANAAGIYASVNNGDKWVQVYQSTDIKKVTVAPSDPNTLYVLMKNNNTDFRKVEITNANIISETLVTDFTSIISGLPSSNATLLDFIVDPKTPNTLYASVFDFTNDAAITGFYRSTNAGGVWIKQITNRLFQKFAIDSTGTTSVLYAAWVDSANNNVIKIEKGTSAGSSSNWSWVNVLDDNTNVEGANIFALKAVDDTVFAATNVGLFLSNATPGTGVGAPNVKLTVTDSPDPIQAGGLITYSMALKNMTTDVNVTNATITSTTFPVNTSLSSVVPSNLCTFNSSIRKVTCSIAQLTKNATSSINLKMKIASTFTGSRVEIAFKAEVVGELIKNDNTVVVTTAVSSVGNTAPTASNSTGIVKIGETFTGNFAATGNGLKYSVESNNTFGKGQFAFVSPSISNNKVSDNSAFTFRPNSTATGTEIIRFTVRDSSNATSNTGTFTITINPAGGTGNPIASNSFVTVSPGNSINGSLTGSGNSITYIVSNPGSKGTFTFINPINSVTNPLESTSPNFTYRANAGETGTDLITFTVKDASGNVSSQANLTVRIQGTAQTPSTNQSSGGGGGAMSPLWLMLSLLILLSRRVFRRV